jgi:tetratricopeptide (TPR) repeat protein
MSLAAGARLGPSARRASRLGEFFKRAASHADVRDEALVRWGYFELRRGRPTEALVYFDQAAPAADDLMLLYWLHLFKGRALERLRRHGEAVAWYKRALDDVPDAAFAAAMIAVGPADRAQLVFALSDGVDTMSFLDADDVVALAGRSSATLYDALQEVTSTGARLSPYDGGPNFNRLRAAAERSGGELNRLRARTSLPAVFQRVLDDFRGGYLLTYVPRGVAPDGWHEIVVRTTNPRHTVRARKGYEGR